MDEMEVILLKGRYFILGCLIGVLIMTIVYAPLTGSQSVGMYDPWKDLNDDGVIDIYDLIGIANSYGTTGNPAKPVIVNGYYAKEWNETVGLNEGESITYRFSTAGLKTLTLQVSIWPTVWIHTPSGDYGYANATIRIKGQILNRTVWSETKNLDAVVYWYHFEIWPPPDEPFHYINTDTTLTRVYSLACSSVEVYIYARSPISCNTILYVTA